MDELISKKKLLKDLQGLKDVLVAGGDPFLAAIMIRAIGCVENQPVIPDAEASRIPEAAPEDKQLEKAIRELREKFAKAQTLDFVYNKLGWALFQTWKKYE